MDILDDMGVSKLSAKVILKVNYSFKRMCPYSVKFQILETINHFATLHEKSVNKPLFDPLFK